MPMQGRGPRHTSAERGGSPAQPPITNQPDDAAG